MINYLDKFINNTSNIIYFYKLKNKSIQTDPSDGWKIIKWSRVTQNQTTTNHGSKLFNQKPWQTPRKKKLVKENQERKKTDYPTTDSSNNQSLYYSL